MRGIDPEKPERPNALCNALNRAYSSGLTDSTNGPSENTQNQDGCCVGSPMYRYAWLEREDGTWHFLTHLFADPEDSTRRWSDKNRALDELSREGWAVVRSYPDKDPLRRRVSEGVRGYGLIRTVH